MGTMAASLSVEEGKPLCHYFLKYFFLCTLGADSAVYLALVHPNPTVCSFRTGFLLIGKHWFKSNIEQERGNNIMNLFLKHHNYLVAL